MLFSSLIVLWYLVTHRALSGMFSRAIRMDTAVGHIFITIGYSYSGKGKNFSITFLVVASDDGLVIGLGAAGPGSVHDVGVVRAGFPDWGRWSRHMLDPGNPVGKRFTVWAGPGYGEPWKILRGADINSPYKKPRGGPAGMAEKARRVARGQQDTHGARHGQDEVKRGAAQAVRGDVEEFAVDAD
ncbi:MAG: transposase family protein [Alphaproteobacteria bacterium]|nr:transposase family protein [Alphaproteobacteria bacterium]MDA8030050.1 transposase family protein [Alphaproteobacteria bacterium]